jgi:hypothetical protein
VLPRVEEGVGQRIVRGVRAGYGYERLPQSPPRPFHEVVELARRVHAFSFQPPRPVKANEHQMCHAGRREID